MGGVIFDNRISEKFVTAAELAKTLRVSIHTIRKWRKQEKIPYYKLGHSLRFRVSEVLTQLQGERSK
ncbi:MAG: helix-turn-helix domain-containing protein [Oligoflexales bacterium]